MSVRDFTDEEAEAAMEVLKPVFEALQHADEDKRRDTLRRLYEVGAPALRMALTGILIEVYAHTEFQDDA